MPELVICDIDFYCQAYVNTEHKLLKNKGPFLGNKMFLELRRPKGFLTVLSIKCWLNDRQQQNYRIKYEASCSHVQPKNKSLRNSKVASRSMSWLVTPHVTNWIQIQLVVCPKINLKWVKVVRMIWNFVRIHETFHPNNAKMTAFYIDKQKSFVPKKSATYIFCLSR